VAVEMVLLKGSCSCDCLSPAGQCAGLGASERVLRGGVGLLGQSVGHSGSGRALSWGVGEGQGSRTCAV
jgi:hypothetical protein